MTKRSLDEDDIRVRPGKGKSRPRTKDRPGYLGATIGWVVTVDRGRFGCVVSAEPDDQLVMAVKARELGRKGVVVGDRVALVGDLTGRTDALARIIRVEPRTTILRRTADDNDPVERVIVANADQLAVVVALADPTPRPGLIDRCLVAAYDAGLRPLLVLTKADLVSPDQLLATYRALDVPFVVTQRGDDLTALREHLAGRRTVFVGHSGVGKSTLVNALIPGTDRATGVVNSVTGRGRHTSTSAVVLQLPDGAGWVIDTPGIRSFGLAHVEVDRVILAFPELAAGLADCPRSCSHDEPECGLDAWVANGHAEPARLESLRRLLRSRATPEDDRDTT